MKATGTIQAGTGLWESPNIGATNESGFSGLPGGFRYAGEFYYVGSYGFWWSSSENGATDAWLRRLYYYGGLAYRYYFNERSGFSVRCLRD
jgi:uncharacterized protein (TIGR02145 family)